MEETRILIVDDEKQSRDIIKGVLQHAHYVISEAADGEEALEMMRKEPPNLIILDIRMPKMDGYDVCYEVKSDNTLMNIPIIMLTVMGETIDKIRGIHLGIDDYIIKPFEPEEFLARVNAVLKRKEFYEEMAMTDSLTDLYNSYFFKNQLEIFFNMAKRTRQEFSLAVIDIDEFKSINDMYGHAVGDYVLKKISELMKNSFRKSDIITRYGGDEFAILLPKLDKDQAKIVVNKLLARLEVEEFIAPKSGKKFLVTVSVGTATWRGEINDAAELFDLADTNMYEDKKKTAAKKKKKKKKKK
ncbi:diguanylate cyclase [Elusimicrobiota bacterium]